MGDDFKEKIEKTKKEFEDLEKKIKDASTTPKDNTTYRPSYYYTPPYSNSSAHSTYHKSKPEKTPEFDVTSKNIFDPELFYENVAAFGVGSGLGLAGYLTTVYATQGRFNNAFEIAVPAVMGGIMFVVPLFNTRTWQEFADTCAKTAIAFSFGGVVYNFFKGVGAFIINSFFDKKFNTFDLKMIGWQLGAGLGGTLIYNIGNKIAKKKA